MINGFIGFPVCKFHDDCRANAKGLCTALNDTNFKNRDDCPFYKTAEQYDAEVAKNKERLEALGRFDLLEKYFGVAVPNEKIYAKGVRV